VSDSQNESFSKRFGYRGPSDEITIREDAPQGFRYAVLDAALKCDLRPKTLRGIVCAVLRARPDPYNWSEYPNIWDEVQGLVYECDWFCVYDIVEAIHTFLSDAPAKAEVFAAAVNDCFHEMGIGWQLKDGMIQTRGDDAHEAVVATATTALEEAALPTAKSELQEAIQDLSRRPEPDLSGAVHHAMAALECVAREVSGDPKGTLGEIVKKHADLLPRPLDEVVAKAWGFSSEVARHGKEERDLNREEVQLIVGLAAVVSTYLTGKFSA